MVYYRKNIKIISNIMYMFVFLLIALIILFIFYIFSFEKDTTTNDETIIPDDIEIIDHNDTKPPIIHNYPIFRGLYDNYKKNEDNVVESGGSSAFKNNNIILIDATNEVDYTKKYDSYRKKSLSR